MKKGLLALVASGAVLTAVMVAKAKSNGAKSSNVITQKQRFFDGVREGKWPINELDSETAAFIGKRGEFKQRMDEFAMSGEYDPERRKYFEENSTDPYLVDLAEAIYQLEGRPDHLRAWAVIYSNEGMQNVADTLTNKAHAIDGGAGE